MALIALYRPGPLNSGLHTEYAERKHGRRKVTYPHPDLEPILKDTYGVMIYQEQVMQVAVVLAGFTMGEADTLRKAMGKKKLEVLMPFKDKFIAGCAQNEVTPAVANQLWKDMEQAQDYSFNKAHAACYALIAYRTAYLRSHHPAEYMAALISSVMNKKDRVPYYVNACHEMGIEVLPPDVNSSQVDFAVVEGKIRFGLNAVKNVGGPAAAAIVRAREEGDAFATIWEFTERVDPQTVNKRGLESLVKAGALDSTGAPRQGMLAVLEDALNLGGRHQADRLAGQGSIFDLAPVEEARPKHHPAIPAGEFEKSELLLLEKEALGLYVSEHPLSAIRDQLRRKCDCGLSELEKRRDGEVVTVGIVGQLKQLTTKKGEQMLFMRLDDVTGGIEVVVFASAYAAARHLLTADTVLVVKGRVDHKEGETKLLALEVEAFAAAPERKQVRLKLDARKASRADPRARRRRPRLSRRGAVFIDMLTSQGPKTLRLGSGFHVQPVPDFFAEVKALLGEAAVAK